MRIRTTKTSSGATAVQVVSYVKRKMVVLNHVGSARNAADLGSLKKIASGWIHGKNNAQLSFLPELEAQLSSTSSIVQIDKCEYLGFRYQLFYDCLWSLVVRFKFHLIPQSKILNDLVITRIATPSSKLEAFEFIADYFGIKHSRRDFYRTLSELPKLKDEVEARVIAVAKKHFSFNFSLVFYDLTTLYFESFETDELRRIGFSKDNKASNPQIMIGLLVNDLGFPISYQVFAGNKFEGHTLLPSITSIRRKHKIKKMTVVADSAMIRIQSESKGDLICSFSNKRYSKEKLEMEKQIEKAKSILKTPSKAEIIKRTKFLKGRKLSYELNQDLIHKTTLLLGIKGYYTNCDQTELSNEEVIKHYKNLWHVEKSFRISKSDLKARPIFHNKQQAIEAHILICFMALALAKYIEIKTNRSIRAVTKELKKVTDARIYDAINKREFVMRSKTNEIVAEILRVV